MASTSMEIDPPADTLKERNDEINKLFKCVDIIITHLGAETRKELKDALSKGIINIDMSDDIAGVLMTVFTCLRKELNDPSGFNRYKAYSATIFGIKVEIGIIVDEIKKEKIELNFLISTPIVELMTLFKSSFDEVRTGVTRFRVRETVANRSLKRDSKGKPKGKKDDSKDLTHSITQYGLNNNHVPLLQGITFAPERRTGVIRSLGPLAQAIMLVMEDRYHNKIHAALMNSIQMLPMASEIANCLRDARNPGQVSGIMKELGDILLLSTGRSTQKF